MAQGLVVISIDGVSHGLLADLMAQGIMPVMAELLDQCGPHRMMRSAIPTVSATAWASYATGCNPGKHGIFGFTDYRRDSYALHLPNAADLCHPTIWEILSKHGRRVFGMNVPGTYPPRPVNGIMIGGFLTPSLDKVARSAAICDDLKGMGYQIDIDPLLARRSKQAMLHDLDDVLEGRVRAMCHYLADELWDYFHAHIMGTDRINHFLLRSWLAGDEELAPAFSDYYRKVDQAIGKVLHHIGSDAPLLICSDHGFCTINWEVNLSRYLVDKGWTVALKDSDGPLAIDLTRSRAFCMTPGRVYINLRGREGQGCVSPGQYDSVREEVARDLLMLRDGDNCPVIRSVLRREDIYWPPGQQCPGASATEAWEVPPYCRAPDLVAVAFGGYDLKTGLQAEELFTRTELEGMHTYHDAFALARGFELPAPGLEIRQLTGSVLALLNVPLTQDHDVSIVPPPFELN